MSKKFLNLEQLSFFLENLKSIFASIFYVRLIEEISDLIIDNTVSNTPNLVKNSAVNSALNYMKVRLSTDI